MRKGFCVFNESKRRFVLATLDFETAHRVNRLRGKSNVAHHRNLGVDERFDHGKTFTSTFEFHGLRAGTNK
ncbi:unannotated protein [freshwater metagenome]|uniref:Unannotated protein n=1 Tax=freshwater metagenome TaxID=449393 RepID=A0A6J6MJ48_9ZZZZ